MENQYENIQGGASMTFRLWLYSHLAREDRDVRRPHADLGSGRIVVSEIQTPNISANTVWSMKWMSGSTPAQRDKTAKP
jgi:hypothetical protein